MKISKVSQIVVLAVTSAFSQVASADDFTILATPPVWFFNYFASNGVATCTAVNLHDKRIALTTRLVIHDDDTLPYPIDIEIGTSQTATQALEPGQATAVSLDFAHFSDPLLARCEFEYKGNPLRVKAAIVLDDQSGSRALTAPAEFVKTVKRGRK